jgi:hypothetical protein
MDIVAALFVEGIDLRTAFEGGPTLIDISGVHFSAPAPAPPPVTVTPHLVVIVRCPPGAPTEGVLEVTFHRSGGADGNGNADGNADGDGERIARNVQPLQVEPGRFTYRLVRAELDLPDYGTVEARCRIGTGPATVVPYTLVPAPAPATG